MRFNRRARVALPLAVALLATACGGDDDTGAADGTDEEPTAAEETTDEEPSETEDEAPAAGDQTLVIWADEKRVPVIEEIAPAFTDATGVAVDVELVPFEEIREQVNLAAPAGEGPDLFIGANDWTGELAANGVIEPIDLGSVSGEFAEVAINAFGFEGSNYAVPYAIEAIAMYVNTDLVAEAPTDFAGVADACAAAAVDNCMVVPGGGAGADAYHNIPFVQAYGATVFGYDADTGSYDPSTVGLDSERAVDAVAFLEDQVEAGIVANTDYDTAKNLWLEGSAAFWVTGPWELGGVRDSGIAFDVALIPQFGSEPMAPFVGSQGFFVNAFSENKLIAQTFLLDFIATQETQQALFEADPRGPAWNAVADGLDDAQVQTFAASAANGLPQPNIPEMGSVWGPLGDNLLQVRNGELTAEEAMTAAAEAVRAAVAG